MDWENDETQRDVLVGSEVHVMCKGGCINVTKVYNKSKKVFDIIFRKGPIFLYINYGCYGRSRSTDGTCEGIVPGKGGMHSSILQ